MGQVAALLERRQLGPHRGRPPLDPRLFGDYLRADRLARLQVGVDDEAQDQLLALGEHAYILETGEHRRIGGSAQVPWLVIVSASAWRCRSRPRIPIVRKAIALRIKRRDEPGDRRPGNDDRAGGLPGGTFEVIAVGAGGHQGEALVVAATDPVPLTAVSRQPGRRGEAGEGEGQQETQGGAEPRHGHRTDPPSHGEKVGRSRQISPQRRPSGRNLSEAGIRRPAQSALRRGRWS